MFIFWDKNPEILQEHPVKQALKRLARLFLFLKDIVFAPHEVIPRKKIQKTLRADPPNLQMS